VNTDARSDEVRLNCLSDCIKINFRVRTKKPQIKSKGEIVAEFLLLKSRV